MRKAAIILVLFLVVQYFSGIALTTTSRLLTGDTFNATEMMNTASYYWLLGGSLLLSNLLMIVIVYHMMKQDGRSPFASYLVSSDLKSFVITLVTLFTMIFWVNGLTELVDVPDMLEMYMDSMIHNPICLLGICVVGPIAEEVCFRRGVLGALSNSSSFKHYALPLSALIFALVHLNPVQMVGAFVLGLFLGWLYMRTHSLILPIVCHIVNNSVSVVLSLLFGTEMKMADLFSGSVPFYIAIAFTLALTVVLMFILFKTLPKSRVIDDYQGKF